MTYSPIPDPARPLSKSSLTSFIFGILGCLPFIAGFLAVIFGIIGLMRTGDAIKRGRWMAILGIILGAISIIGWSGVSLMGGGIWAIFKATQGPRIAAHDFIRDVSAGNDAAAKADTDSMSDADYDAAATQIRAAGKFVDTTFSSTNITNDSAEATGNAVFNDGTKDQPMSVIVNLKNIGGHWKVEHFTLTGHL